MRQKWLQKPPLGTPINCSHPSAKGRVGDWIFNEGGGDLVNDLSGNANHGTLKNMAFPPTTASGWNPGRAGVGLKFDGANDYVDCGNEILFDSTKPLTISLWTNVDDYVGSTFPCPILLKTDQATGFVVMYHSPSAEWLGITFGSNANFVLRKTAIDISADLIGVWKHIVITFDGVDRTSIASYKLFVDAVEQSLNAGSLTPVVNVNYIGRGHSDNYTWFDGQIDQLRIYNRALSEAEIIDSYIDPFGMFERNNLWDYVSAPPVGAVMNQFQKGNIGADLYDGVLIA